MDEPDYRARAFMAEAFIKQGLISIPDGDASIIARGEALEWLKK
ncbi:MAG: hypothetical protein P8P30_00300 [Rickettsiales bacterium]|nr:hypothetical protein [Rickettsiales bacterium]